YSPKYSSARSRTPRRRRFEPLLTSPLAGEVAALGAKRRSRAGRGVRAEAEAVLRLRRNPLPTYARAQTRPSSGTFLARGKVIRVLVHRMGWDRAPLVPKILRGQFHERR